jgi:hypothetical protein
MAAPTDDSPPPERPAQVGAAIVTEIRKDDGRLLLIYHWPLPADAPR